MRRERWIHAAIVLLILAVGGIFFHPPGWNQNARLAATLAFVEPGTPYTGTFEITGLKDTLRAGTGDWAQAHGAFYSNKAPGVSLLGIVPYWIAYHVERSSGLDPATVELTRINAFVLNLFISVFWNAVAAVAIVRKLPKLGVHSADGAALVAMVYSFATLVLPFGCAAWGHSTAAAFITLGSLELADDSPKRSVAAGLWLGMALLTEYMAAIVLATSGLFVLSRSDRGGRWWRFAIGAAGPILVLLVYQKMCFGSYLTPAPSLSAPEFLETGKVFGLFGVPSWRITRRIFFRFSGERGLLFQMPILILSAAGMVSWYRSGRRALLAFAAANIVLYTLSISSMQISWHGGVTTSMRYMIVALPFFCLLMPDLQAFAYRRTFLVLFALTAANMFALAATSTMYYSEAPLSEFAYPDLWKGAVSVNPLLARAGLGGRPLALTIAVLYTLAVASLAAHLLRRRSTSRV